MPLVLSDVPTPRYSDGVTQYYPTVYKAARAPAGGYVECHPSRVRKYLDRLSASLKDIYIRNPTKIPGIQPELLRAGESIVFRGNSGLLEFPKNYKMFESKKPEGLGGGETPGVGTPGGGESPMLGPKEGAGEDPESDAVLTKLEQGDGDGKQAKTPKGESRFRADAFIFGHPSGSKYRSTNEFTPHLEWLVTDDTHDHKNCPCKLCTNFTRSGSKPHNRGKPLPVAETPNASPPTYSKLNPAYSSRSHPSESKSSRKKVASKGLPSDDIGGSRDWEHDIRDSARSSPIRHYSDDDEDDRESWRSQSRKSKSKSGDKNATYNDMKSRKKYKELKRKISEIEEDTDRIREEYEVAKKRLHRLKFEKGLLYDRLQEVSVENHTDGHTDTEASDIGRHRSPPPFRPTSPPPRGRASKRGRKRDAHEAGAEQHQPPTKKPKKERIKKPYDPNAPKRPTNAFMFFCDETREGLRKERNEMKGAEIEEKGLSNLTKALGARWKSLNERERSDWRARFLTEVKRYDREMEEYSGTAPPLLPTDSDHKSELHDDAAPVPTGGSEPNHTHTTTSAMTTIPNPPLELPSSPPENHHKPETSDRENNIPPAETDDMDTEDHFDDEEADARGFGMGFDEERLRQHERRPEASAERSRVHSNNHHHSSSHHNNHEQRHEPQHNREAAHPHSLVHHYSSDSSNGGSSDYAARGGEPMGTEGSEAMPWKKYQFQQSRYMPSRDEREGGQHGEGRMYEDMEVDEGREPRAGTEEF